MVINTSLRTLAAAGKQSLQRQPFCGIKIDGSRLPASVASVQPHTHHQGAHHQVQQPQTQQRRTAHQPSVATKHLYAATAPEDDDNRNNHSNNTLHDAAAPAQSFRAADLQVHRCDPHELKAKPSADNLLFGHEFTDHMFRVDWSLDEGWSRPVVSKVHNLDLHPAAKVLHYAIEAFEGAKAYRGHDNRIRFFRLDQNLKRLAHSAQRLALPAFDERELMRCIHELVKIDQDWIPEARGGTQLTSLYVRPTIMGVEPSLGVARSRKAILYVLLSPVGPYFKTGFKPISLYADPRYVRAWPGSAGNTKLGSNYAPTIMVQRQAEQLGLQQVLWLYGDDLKLTEVGTMNIFVSHISPDNPNKLHLVTPPLDDGLILPGITRASILDLARQWPDVVVEERYMTIGEIRQMLQQNILVEMFGAGTACVVCPISSIHMTDGTTLRIPYFDITKDDTTTQQHQQSVNNLMLTKRILSAITDIQYGRTPHQWAQELK